MSALDDILKRSEFPAVRKCYQDFHAFGKQSVPWSAFDAIEELATKLAKSIEWGRIERKRKENLEELADEIGRLNRRLKAGREEWLLATDELEVVTDQLAHEREEHDKLKEEVARLRDGMRRICNELGVPDATYPANVANAYGIAHGDCEADLDNRVWRM